MASFSTVAMASFSSVADKLVAITSCTDVWQHPAVVRYAMTPQLPPWRPAKHLAMANYQTHLREVQSRWASRGNW